MISDGVYKSAHMDRYGDFMHTINGIDFWPLDPIPEEVDLDDIAHALSRICRFNGHTTSHFSVAQHAVIVSFLVPEHFALDGLHHDDTEAYVADLVRPVKRNIPEYKAIESALYATIALRFGLCQAIPPEVDDIDKRIVADEAEQLYREVPPWTKHYRKVGVRVRPVPAFLAKRLYLHRHHELTDPVYRRSLRARVWRFVAALTYVA